MPDDDFFFDLVEDSERIHEAAPDAELENRAARAERRAREADARARRAVEQLATHRLETQKWATIVTVAVIAFVAGNLSSQWFDMRKEMRDLTERIAVMEATSSAPKLPDGETAPSTTQPPPRQHVRLPKSNP